MAGFEQVESNTVADNTGSTGDEDGAEVRIEGELSNSRDHVGKGFACLLEQTHGRWFLDGYFLHNDVVVKIVEEECDESETPLLATRGPRHRDVTANSP